MNQPTSFKLSQEIVQQLRAVRRLLRQYVLWQGVLRTLLWLLLVFWLGGLIDYFPVTLGSSETPRWLRIALLLLMAAGSGWIFFRGTLARLAVTLHDASLALLIERRYPELNNELVTAVELSSKSASDISNPTAHRAMLQRVHSSVAQHIAVVKPATLFDWQPLWTAGVASGLGLLVTLIAAVSIPDWTGRWARRLFTLADEPWPRQAGLRADGIQLQIPAFSAQLSSERMLVPFENGVARVPNGAAALLQISADTKAPQVPEVCTLFYDSDDGTRGRANLRRVGSPRDGWQQFTLDGPPLDGLSENISIDVVGLDARLRDLTIEVVEPAVIARMRLHCVYPSYLLDSFSARAATETLEYRNGATIPEGTEVTLLGSASSSLSRLEYVVRSAAPDSTPSPAPGVSLDDRSLDIRQATPTGKEFRIPLGKLSANQVVEVRLVDEFGLSADQIPRYVIAVQEDAVPEVNTQLSGIGLAITPNAILPLIGTVTDDHGVADVTVELAVNDSPPLNVPVPLQDTQLETTVDLEKLREQQPLPLAAGATLGLVVSARDHYNLGGQQHTGRGQPMQLAVVTADQLLVMLDRQELELRQRLELIISELEQMHEVLDTLRIELNPPGSARLGRPDFGQRSAGVQLVATNVQPNSSGETRGDQVRRLASLWAQQSILQADKSQQELVSVVARVDNLRMQLVNNRIDSYDRQQRLLTQVHDPLVELLSHPYETLRSSLSELQTATLSGAGAEQAGRSSAALQTVLLQLAAIQASMLDIESFNEIIDLVRGLLEDQEKVLSQTEQEQRQRILDLLR
ncbi:MAG: hypothetical protein KDA45_01505 [Planctomycetales bacterium]|nr:hypothetical protein [Planctomycetales bacterium]